MKSNNSTKSVITVAVVGLPLARAKLLCSSLERVEPSRFQFVTIPGSFADISNSDQISNAVVLAGAEGLGEDQSLITVAQKLRTDLFHWEPIHLFLRTPPQRSDPEEEWCIYFQKLPPDDIRSFAKILSAPRALSRERRGEIIRFALMRLVGELGSMLRSLDPTAVLEPDTLRNSLHRVRAALPVGQKTKIVKNLRAELKRIEQLPSMREQDIDTVAPLVIEAETWGRRSDASQPFRLALHKLSNDLRRAKWRPEAGTEVAARVQALLKGLQKKGIELLPRNSRADVTYICNALGLLTQSVLEGNAKDVIPSEVTEFLIRLRDLTRRLDPHQNSLTLTPALERIVVVEDDPDWRRLIAGVLQSMILPVEIHEAGTVEAAAKFLEEPISSLVLVDLGLPQNESSPVVLDAGLSLIKRFTGTEVHSRHRFVVLTAAENYADAVRAALGLGISPANYLQKDPETWEGELHTQVRLLMQPPSIRLPRIEVFARSGRIARIEGLEVRLDRPHWCLLAAFGGSRKQLWCHTDAIARVLANEPYALDPESRGADTSELDPKDRIKRQLPHYVADLRANLNEAYTQAKQAPPPDDFIDFDDETNSYRLNASIQVLDRVDEHYRIGHRPSVIVVEDDTNWGQEIVKELKRQGFDPRWARWTDEAWEMINEKIPDLFSLDLEIPTTRDEWTEGQADTTASLKFLHRLRDDCPDLPVAILTAIPWQDSVMLKMLRNGVSVRDYLSKHWQDPISRLASSLARLWQEVLTQSRILEWDTSTPMYPIRIDKQTGLLSSVADYPIQTAGKSSKIILKLISETPNTFVSRTELIDAVYPDPDDWPEDINNALDSHVSRIRRAITKSTNIPGDQIICGDHGVLWLRGIVQ